MPPTTASSFWSSATSRLVMSKRFRTFGSFGGISRSSLREGFAAGQQRRKDQACRRLGRDRLLDRAVQDELELVDAGDRVMLDAKRLEHRPHGAADHGLPQVELAERAALGDDHDQRDL